MVVALVCQDQREGTGVARLEVEDRGESILEYLGVGQYKAGGGSCKPSKRGSMPKPSAEKIRTYS